MMDKYQWFELVSKNQINELKSSVKSGFDHNQCQDINGFYSLHFAANNSSLESAKYLIDIGHDINAQDNNKMTALHWGVLSSNFDFNEYLLLQDNINVNLKDKMGNTPLSYAIEHNSHGEIILMLAKNPDLTIRNNDNESYIDIASKVGDKDLIIYIENEIKKNEAKLLLKENMTRIKTKKNKIRM